MAGGKDDVKRTIKQVLEVNMGVTDGETVLIMTDVPTAAQWKSWESSDIKQVCSRAVLAREVAEIAEALAENAYDVVYLPYPCTGQAGEEPGSAALQRMQESDVVIAITSFSITHTRARHAACDAGGRVASMPGATREMFDAEGPMSADYAKVAKETAQIASWLTPASEARVKSPIGTDITFSIEGRKGGADDGIYTEPGSWGNLPAGEAYVAPVEGTAEGKIVVGAGNHPGVDVEMALYFEDGEAVAVEGGGAAGKKFEQILGLGNGEKTPRSRRNLAELGIGTNPKATSTESVLEAEKIYETVHLALGDSSHLGGECESDYHEDFVIYSPTLILDGETVMENGDWLR